jgi:hypothetical protein
MWKQQRTPIVLLAMAAGLAGGVYWLESRKAQTGVTGPVGSPSGSPSGSSSLPIVNASEAEFEAIGIKTLVQTIVLDKTPAKPDGSKGEWMLRSPKPEGAASEAAVAYLTSLLVGKSEPVLTVTGSRKAEFGLDQPLATIEMRLPNQQMQMLVLGKLNFNRTGLYAVLNPPADPNASFPLMLVSPSFESAVSRSIAEWRKNPVKPSPKPSGKPIPQSPPQNSPQSSPQSSPQTSEDGAQ